MILLLLSLSVPRSSIKSLLFLLFAQPRDIGSFASNIIFSWWHKIFNSNSINWVQIHHERNPKQQRTHNSTGWDDEKGKNTHTKQLNDRGSRTNATCIFCLWSDELQSSDEFYSIQCSSLSCCCCFFFHIWWTIIIHFIPFNLKFLVQCVEMQEIQRLISIEPNQAIVRANV